MAEIIKLSPEQRASYEAWIAARPPEIQAMIRSHPPIKLYRLATTGQRVTIDSYAEDGTVTVILNGRYNVVVMDRRIFNIPLSELTECELPAPDESTGTALFDPVQVERFVEASRPYVLSIAQKNRLTVELREMTGLGLMLCKSLLTEHNWDIGRAYKAARDQPRRPREIW
jgi:hypothetical protein